MSSRSAQAISLLSLRLFRGGGALQLQGVSCCSVPLRGGDVLGGAGYMQEGTNSVQPSHWGVAPLWRAAKM